MHPRTLDPNLEDLQMGMHVCIQIHRHAVVFNLAEINTASILAAVLHNRSGLKPYCRSGEAIRLLVQCTGTGPIIRNRLLKTGFSIFRKFWVYPQVFSFIQL